jgi:glycosyltransferase involved in cell wall biosynthesis
MILKKNIIKIATILPYKENYTKNNASAVSLWVSEFFNKSKFKKNNIIYGNTSGKDYLTENYKNIFLKNLNSRFKSTTTEYTNKLIDQIKNIDFDIIEIHNRPLIFKQLQLRLDIKSKYIIYFHNDPLSMSGSKTTQERENILKNCHKLIFISEWVKKRFFLNIDNKLLNKSNIIYHSVNRLKIKKKNKYITFVGKLNHAKGYDIYKDAILKILDEFQDWKAFSIGDESRRQIYINHKQHKELGFMSHVKTLDFFNKSEIAVIPSRWEEPFGRTSLEASSVGCATIISGRGGLKETTDHAIILKKNNAQNLYYELKKLILNKKKRVEIQNFSRKNVKHLITKNTKLIDGIRHSIIPYFNFGIIKKKLRIVNIYNAGQKLNHRLVNISLGKKFTNGFIRNGHDVLDVSDRDFIKANKFTNLFNRKINFQKYLIDTFKNYNPDFLLFGHSNNINIDTINELKSINKNLVISQWNEDPIMSNLDYSKKNISNINLYSDIVDHNFITTHPSIAKKKINSKNLHFFFIPVDANIEQYDVYNMNTKSDLFYAMSHGVNRSTLIRGTEDSRSKFLNRLIKKIPNIAYDFYGYDDKQPIWGNNFNNAIINSKMGLNLSRGKPTKHYSSNRIASLIGNGLLTFIDEKVEMNSFFNPKEIVFYSTIDDLADKINFFSRNDVLRKKIAKNGKKKYFKLFNEKKITKYILDVSIGNNAKLI